MPPGRRLILKNESTSFSTQGLILAGVETKAFEIQDLTSTTRTTGTHPAVRVFYSPKMVKWLADDRKDPIPEGAMIIKEQYTPPGARYIDMNETQLSAAFAKSKDWTVMIKDPAGAKDGWFWGEFYAGMTFDEWFNGLELSQRRIWTVLFTLPCVG